jgi:hypothetical protein
MEAKTMRKFLTLAIVMALGGWALNRMTRKDEFAVETIPSPSFQPEEPGPEMTEEPATLAAEQVGNSEAMPAVAEEAPELDEEVEEAAERVQEPIDLGAAPKRRRKASSETENWSPVVDFEPTQPESQSDLSYLPDVYRQEDEAAI